MNSSSDAILFAYIYALCPVQLRKFSHQKLWTPPRIPNKFNYFLAHVHFVHALSAAALFSASAPYNRQMRPEVFRSREFPLLQSARMWKTVITAAAAPNIYTGVREREKAWRKFAKT